MDKDKIINILSNIENGVIEAKKIANIKKPTNFDDIELGFHLSQIQYHSKQLKESLNENGKKRLGA